jgi:hypothetical protein
MKEPQYRLRIATQRNGSVVCWRQHLLGMDVIRSKLSSMDSWKTLQDFNPGVGEKQQRTHYEKETVLVIHRLNADRQCMKASEER